MSRMFKLNLAVLMAVLVSSLTFSYVGVDNKGTWPKSWPEELESLRDQSRTVDVLHGIKEKVYEIPFTDADQFARAWPHILKVKTPGAPLILEKAPSMYCVSGTCCSAGARILAPSNLYVGELTAGPPWPENLKTPKGSLPEYVIHEEGKWIPADPNRQKGDYHSRLRARTDIVLIVDGDILDLNKIPLPPHTPIIDNRFKDQSKDVN
ncbi:hypothetical protein STSP2_01267 [Anaerohalosphaera lusitana]|uniref:Uncharacterized protein n=1 Tax=Anaerohalosphaera lusitana TaxID=1936003 RepID=A0A1U9NJK7_9BACT|nr:hypothetical protein [Anaerohalosphaera lusitana]AQT68112.1 hypothetical protein STSP2_01267 [Anaerohalosphaera lusitana]